VLTRRRFLEIGSLSFAGSLGLSSTGFAEATSLPGLRKSVLHLPALPQAWDGLRILQISDVHAGPYMTPSRMRQIRDLAAELPADVILFTGDQVDRREIDAEFFAHGFSGLSAPLGVYGILGNHDHFIDPSLSEGALVEAGIRPLVNSSVVFERGGSRLALVGVDDLSARDDRGPDFSLLEQHPGAYRICLCHQPQGWQRALAAGANLTLAGHTHGGQIALTTRNLNVARLSTRYIAGPYRRDDQYLYVSRGIGVGAVPVRFGAPPEIDLLILRRAAQSAQLAA